MTPYIEAKKAEVREKFNNTAPAHYHLFLETLIDTLLDEIESRVCAEFEPNQSEIDLIRSAFQHLRTGVETEV